MAENKRLLPIKEIVKEALFEMGEDTLTKYPRALSFALSYYRKFHKEKAREFKKNFYNLDSLKRLLLPEDFVDWVTIGVVDGDRVVQAFENKSTIGIAERSSCNVRQPYPSSTYSNSIEGSSSAGTVGHSGIYGTSINSWGENAGGISGKAGTRPALNFTFLKDENALQFNTGLAYDSVYMEYLAYPFNVGEQTLVHYYAVDPLKSFLWYEFAYHNNNSTESEIDRKRRRHKKEHSKAGAQMSHLTPHDIINYGRMADHQGVRI